MTQGQLRPAPWTYFTSMRGALVLLIFIGEWLPWLTVGEFKVSCFVWPWQAELMNMPSLYLLYVLPVVTIPAVIRGVMGYPNRLGEFLTGAATLLTFSILAGWHEGTHPLIGLPAYASVAIAIVLIADSIGLLGGRGAAHDAVEPQA